LKEKLAEKNKPGKKGVNSSNKKSKEEKE